MQRKFLLIKVLIALTAVAVQLRLNVPSYSVKLAVTSAGLSIKIARREPLRVHKRDVAEGAEGQNNTTAKAAALEGGADSSVSGSPHQEQQGEAPAAVGRESSQASESAAATASPQSEAKIEFMNIAPEGTSVLAGRAEPGARVTVLENGTPVGTTVAGSDGDWSLATEHRFVKKDPSADLHAVAGGPPPAPPTEATTTGKTAVEVAAAAVPNGPPTGPAAHLIQEFADTVAAAREEAADRPRPAAEPVRTAEAPLTGPYTATGAQPVNKEVAAADAGRATTASSPTAAPASRAVGNGADVAATMPARLDTKAPPTPEVIPIPIQFVYRETTLTEDGERAVALLVEYLSLKNFDSVTLSGHADERGTPEFNLDLSRQRLEAVVGILRKGGYEGAVKVLPKGESEPFAGVDRDRFEREDLLQLDRRVELRLAR